MKINTRQLKVGMAVGSIRDLDLTHFFLSGEPGDLDFALARHAVADYEKAAGDVEGVLDLILTCVEMAARREK